MKELAMAVVAAVFPGSPALAAERVAVSVAEPEVTQHEATHLGIRIENRTKHAVVLDMVRIEEIDVAYGWVEQVYGSLSYSEGDDSFRHNGMAQMASAFKLGSALVAPGGQAQYAMPLTLDESGPVELTVILSYYVIDSDALAGSIYLLREASALEVKYGPATAEELARPESAGALPEHFVTRDLPRPKQTRAKVALTVKEAAFPLEDAMQRVAVVAHEFDAANDKWLLDTAAGMWVVTGDSAQFHPGLGAGEYRFVAESGDMVPFWFLLENLREAVRSRVKERIARYEPQEGMGVRFDVPSAEVPALAAELQKMGLRLELGDFQLTPMLAVRLIGG